MLDQEGTVIAERFRFDVEIDEIMKPLAHWGAGKRAAGLRRTKNSKPHVRGPISLGKSGSEHRQTTSRLRFARFILQNIPVFREHAVGHSDDIGGDPISGSSSS